MQIKLICVHLSSLASSLEEYERKVLTGHLAENRYAQPLAVFWERDRNDLLSPIAADYACRVRALMELAQELDKVDILVPGS